MIAIKATLTSQAHYKQHQVSRDGGLKSPDGIHRYDALGRMVVEDGLRRMTYGRSREMTSEEMSVSPIFRSNIRRALCGWFAASMSFLARMAHLLRNSESDQQHPPDKLKTSRSPCWYCPLRLAPTPSRRLPFVNKALSIASTTLQPLRPRMPKPKV